MMYMISDEFNLTHQPLVPHHNPTIDIHSLICHSFPHPHLLPSITSMSFQTLLFTLCCPSFPDVPIGDQPQVHPPCIILDQCDFFLPPIHSCLGPQPIDPVNFKCLVKQD